MRSPSSSSWGCELKSYRLYSALYCVPVILFMRMWVEKNGILAAYYGNFGHPPCEDVSWKTSHNTRIQTYNCHPPCEDVSWKVQTKIRFHTFRASSSLWGCELKILNSIVHCFQNLNPPCEVVSWKYGMKVILDRLVTVILLVRMWVEIMTKSSVSESWRGHPLRENVSWNVIASTILFTIKSHPLREDVSWNAIYNKADIKADGSSSSRGRELKCFYTTGNNMVWRHPLREDVSWNYWCLGTA